MFLLLLKLVLLKHQIRVAKDSLPFNNIDWFTNRNSYLDIIAHFQKLISNISPAMIDIAIQHSISDALTSTIIAIIVCIQINYKKEMFTLLKIIEKSLFLKKSGFSTPPPDSNTYSKVSLLADLSLKAPKKCNSANLGYFDSHFNKVYDKGEMILVSKDIYYWNIMLFVQHLRSLATFKEVIFVKANITIFF